MFPVKINNLAEIQSELIKVFPEKKFEKMNSWHLCKKYQEIFKKFSKK